MNDRRVPVGRLPEGSLPLLAREPRMARPGRLIARGDAPGFLHPRE